MTTKRKQPGGNHPKPTRWRNDADYLDKLSPEELVFYRQFSNAMYNNEFKSEVGKRWSKSDKRATRAANKAALNDSYARAEVFSTLAPIEDAPERSIAVPEPETPAYLDDPAYKKARDEFRRCLSQTRRNSPPDLSTPKLERTFKTRRAKLEKVIANGQAQHAEDRRPPAPSTPADNDAGDSRRRTRKRKGRSG